MKKYKHVINNVFINKDRSIWSGSNPNQYMTRLPILTSERRGLAEGAVLVAEVGGAVAGAEGWRGGQDHLLLDEAGLGVVRGELGQPLVQGVPQEVQALGRLAQEALGLGRGAGSFPGPQCISPANRQAVFTTHPQPHRGL